MKSINGILTVLIIAVLALVFTLYTIDQRQAGLVMVLGELQKKNGEVAVKQPGLHFKIPLVTKIIRLDNRLQTLTATPEIIPTADQNFVTVDYFVKWRIVDFVKFYLRSTGDGSRIDTLLTQTVSNVLRTEFGSKSLEDVISEDRAQVMTNITKQLEIKSRELGIKIVDMRIKQIELPQEVSDAVYNQMKLDRQKDINAYLAYGMQQSQEIRADADKQVATIVANANRQSLELRGGADAKVADIYAAAYNKDVKFYDFYRSLQAYQQIFNHTGKALVLGKQNEFFKYFIAQQQFNNSSK